MKGDLETHVAQKPVGLGVFVQPPQKIFEPSNEKAGTVIFHTLRTEPVVCQNANLRIPQTCLNLVVQQLRVGTRIGCRPRGRILSQRWFHPRLNAAGCEPRNKGFRLFFG